MEKEPSSKKWDASTWEAYLTYHCIAIGLGSGALLSPDSIKAMNEAQDQFQEFQDERHDDDEDKRPPKPPRRPNARVGRIALGWS